MCVEFFQGGAKNCRELRQHAELGSPGPSVHLCRPQAVRQTRSLPLKPKLLDKQKASFAEILRMCFNVLSVQGPRTDSCLRLCCLIVTAPRDTGRQTYLEACKTPSRDIRYTFSGSQQSEMQKNKTNHLHLEISAKD